MANEIQIKKFKARFQQKCDTTDNLNKEETFTPLKGEAVIYQDYKEDGTPISPKYKIGVWDGIEGSPTQIPLKDLPFSSGLLEPGKGENSIQQVGTNAIADADYAIAIGNYTQTLHENQIALGTYNDAQNEDDIFMIGNGSSTLRKNAFIVKKNGIGYLGNKKILVEGDIADSYTKEEIDAKLGDIDFALDTIIEIQESLIGGNV